MHQNSETHLKNPAALYKIFKECPTIHRKLCDVKFLKIVCYIFYFNQMTFKFSFKNGVEVAFVSLSVRLFQRCGPREDIAILVVLN